MSTNGLEIESKFYVRDLETLENRLVKSGATCIVPRAFEYNLRFDDAQNNLQREHKVLRLRTYDDARLAFKGPGQRVGGALSRVEIELVVSDFDTARQFLESLGYRVVAIYEKYRAMYQLGSTLITLDELPYGHFVEIEGENPEKIGKLARELGLKPENAIPASYQGLFEQIKAAKNLSAQNLTFNEFKSLQITAADLNVSPAD